MNPSEKSKSFSKEELRISGSFIRAFLWIFGSIALWIFTSFLSCAGIFSPLKQVEKAFPIDHGGIILLKGEEFRGRDCGFDYKVLYEKAPYQQQEEVAHWMIEGAEAEISNLRYFSVNKLVVIFLCNRSVVHVRTKAEKWKRFGINFEPRFSFASPADQQKMRDDLTEAERTYHSFCHLENFDPSTLTFKVSYHQRLLSLKLSEDGEQISLIKIEKAPNT
jgi:hypothetical protein